MIVTKFLLIVWIGVGQTQALSIQNFESELECEAAAAILSKTISHASHDWYKCVPYTFERK